MPFKPGQSGNPAGRKPGALSTRTLQLRDKARRMGCDPLEVMINEIRDLLARSKRDQEHRNELRLQAVEVAAKLAPYLHPKLAAIELSAELKHSGTIEHRLTREDLAAMSPAERVQAYRDAIRGEKVIELVPDARKISDVG